MPIRLARFGDRGSERPDILDRQDRIRDLSGLVSDFAGAALDPQALEELEEADVGRLAPPVGRVGKIVCVGPNYGESARLAGFQINPEPTIFMKAPSALNGPNDPIELPRMASRVDWGVELAVVIGRTAKYVAVEQALDHVAGFALANDVTERNFQLQRGGQWFKGKSHDSFAPIGPWLVTKNQIAHDEVELWLEANGVLQQKGSTSEMVFKVPFLVSYISRFVRLEPGDIILTGTPGGVGLSYDPPRFLKAGDRPRLGGTGPGKQSAVCIPA